MPPGSLRSSVLAPLPDLFPRFYLRLLGLCAAGFMAAVLAPPAWVEPLNAWTARLTGFLLGAAGLEVQIHGAVLTLEGFHVRIIPECTPLFPFLLLFSFLLAYPAGIRERCTGVLLGGAFLVTANGLRLALLVLIGRRLPSLFEVAHVYLGQVGMVFCVVAAGAAWLRSVRGRGLQKGRRPGFLGRFAAVSSVLFLAWAQVSRTYIRWGDLLIGEVAGWWDWRLVLPRERELYYHTFSFVALAGILLAVRSTTLGERVRRLAFGLGVLASLHLAVRVGNVLATGMKVESGMLLSVFAAVTAQYTVPFLVWAWIANKDSHEPG